MALRGLTRIILAAALSGAAAANAGAEPAARAAAPAAAATLYDRMVDPITAAMRVMLATAGHGGGFLSKRDGAAVAEYYSEQGFAPSWTEDGRLTARALKIIGRLAMADADGLDPKEFLTPPVGFGKYAAPSPAALAKAEITLSEAILAYTREAYAGRLDPAAVSPNFGYERHFPDPIAVLATVASAANPAAALDAYNPPQPEFQRLREKLAELRLRGSEKKPPVIPVGATLKPGMSDPRVVLLRERLGVPAAADDSIVYDPALVAAMESFQASMKLKADGVIGKGTIAALNQPAADPIATIVANLERWRWMPREMGRFYVRVNVPDFTLAVYKNGSIIHTTRIVVGQVTKQTPIFSDEIENIVVNPSWNVPESIAVKEMLPLIQADPSYFSRSNFQVLANVGGRFRPVDPSMIDWYSVDVRKIHFKQPPGDANALGHIKFNFPNQFAVYLHDTPSKSLFQRDYRALSHGCMRVMDPMAFADVLFAEEHDGWNSGRIKKLIGGPEQMIQLEKHIPVHVTYFTAWVDADGTLQTRPDLYRHDHLIEAAFGLL
jgi:murein L,D-transpeptidase YcbB/YkuD